MSKTKRNRKHFNSFPKYLQLREILKKRMVNTYKVGDLLPSEAALCEEFNISRETVREALRTFEIDGNITRKRGQGTFLIKIPDAAVDPRLTGHIEDLSELRLNTHAKVLKSLIKKNDQETKHLADTNSNVYFIRRLRYFDDAPLAILDAYLTVATGKLLKDISLSNTSIVKEIRDTLNIPCYEEKEIIEATVASPIMAKELHVENGSALLVLKRYFTDKDGKPLILFKSFYRADSYYYTLNLSNPKN